MKALKLGDLRNLGAQESLFHSGISKIRGDGGEDFLYSPEFRKLLKMIRQGKKEEVFSILSLKQLELSTHPRAGALLEWLKSDKLNLKWYLENVGINFDLVQDGIQILGNIWELEDVKMEKSPEKGIRNIDGDTYFNFNTQKDLLGDSIPSAYDWEEFFLFLPGDDKNKIRFLLKILGLNLSGTYSLREENVSQKGVSADYLTSTGIDSDDAYYVHISHPNIFHNYSPTHRTDFMFKTRRFLRN